MVLTGRAPGNLPPPSRPHPQSLLPSLNCYLPHFCCSFAATRRQGACERKRTRSPVEARISPLRQLSAKKTKSKRKEGGWGWSGRVEGAKESLGWEEKKKVVFPKLFIQEKQLKWTSLDNSFAIVPFYFRSLNRAEPT